MHLGVRHIRTAGKGSGSIELTLPAPLRDLVGLPCQITLRDGSRPDIVLQPDMQRAHDVFALIWARLADILLATAVPGGFPLARFMLALQPQQSSGSPPFLAWRDGLSLSDGQHFCPQAMSRVLASCAQAMAVELAVSGELAPGFGVAVGEFLTGAAPYPSDREYQDLAAFALRAHVRPRAAETWKRDASIHDMDFWRTSRPVVRHLSLLFQSWTEEPCALDALRLAWRRGRSIELSGV